MVTNRDRKSSGLRRKNSKSWLDDWHLWRFIFAFGHFGTHFAKSFLMSKSSWMIDPTHSHEMPSRSAIDLSEIRQSSKISLWIWSLISGWSVLGRPGWSASQVEKLPRLKWSTQFVTVVYDGAYSPNFFCQSGVNFLLRLDLQKKKYLTARVSMLLKSQASPDVLLSASVTRKDLKFGTWTDPSFQIHYRFRPTKLGIRSG